MNNSSLVGGLGLLTPVPEGEAELIHSSLLVPWPAVLLVQEQVEPLTPGEESQAVLYCGLHSVSLAYSLCIYNDGVFVQALC